MLITELPCPATEDSTHDLVLVKIGRQGHRDVFTTECRHCRRTASELSSEADMQKQPHRP